MDFTPSARSVEYRDRLLSFMAEHVYPAEPVFSGAASCRAR
jgi:acyl-CoA dehydrogenase